MKKLPALLMLLCLLPLCLLPLCAAAEAEDNGVTVALDGAEVYFVPFEGYCLTRETSASVFNRLGMSQREVVPWMEEYGVYALIFDTADEMEVQIVVSPTTELDFDDMNQYGLESMCEVNASYYTSSGDEVLSSELYHTFDGHTYVKTVSSYDNEDGSKGYMAEYLTSQSGYVVSVFVYPYEGEVTEAQMLLAQGVVESLWLSKNPVEGQLVELSRDGIRVQFYLPEGMTCLTKESSEDAWYGLPKDLVHTRQKELARNVVLGTVISSDGLWEIQWDFDFSDAGGDMDVLLEAEAEDFRQQLVASYHELGQEVLESACEWIGPYRYVKLRYSFAEGGRMTRVNEHYTRQEGWHIYIYLIAYGEPAPEDVQTMLEEILENQTITVYEQGGK